MSCDRFDWFMTFLAPDKMATLRRSLCKINQLRVLNQLFTESKYKRLTLCHSALLRSLSTSVRFCKENDKDPHTNEKKVKDSCNKLTPAESVAEEDGDSSSSSSSDSSSDSDTEKEVLDKELVSAAKLVADHLPGDKKKTESALLSRLLAQKKTAAEQRDGKPPQAKDESQKLRSLMKGLKFDVKQEPKEQPTTKRPLKGSKRKGDGDFEVLEEEDRGQSMNLFTGTPLGIFKKETMKTRSTSKKSLLDIVAEERKLDVTEFPPHNGFEEMIQWTKEGKLWTFPIDNEAGWEEEKQVKFQEHVLLENQIRDFPQKGPIRHFMELVTVSLSKNPYLTVQQKHEHIDWFRQYFNERKEILEAKLGADGVIGSSKKSGREKISKP
ncbi:28S ribosomal protein S31, mitochondrial-like [Dreissena polymorpha]|uniref:Small ribosomal subunit protein mS31 n=1 Tax=Dreissena polymorpha TaxID=45954 RepID=A0A9D4HWN1_DREPO|nr:28S ribosomal protein S31, mitochondrial-like [Dreissena polymorpha]KAH3735458.1 hypothetical protein DPMN_041989 [Dreissena polymorpha]